MLQCKDEMVLCQNGTRIFLENRGKIAVFWGWKRRCEMAVKFSSFGEFYPFYLREHSNSICRRLHFVGTTLILCIAFYAFFSGSLIYLWLLPVVGYGFAWMGHFIFEKNRPATFKHPFYSLMGDFVMYKDMVIGRVKF